MTMIKDRFLVNYKRFDTESGTYYLYNNSIKKLYNKFNITEDNEEEMLNTVLSALDSGRKDFTMEKSHISHICEKIEDDSENLIYIQTVWVLDTDLIKG